MDGAAPPFPSPLTGPTPWVPLVEAGDREAGGPGERFPGEHWPRLEAIEYVSKLLMLIILLLALPWLFGKLLSHPGSVPRHAAHMTSVGA